MELSKEKKGSIAQYTGALKFSTEDLRKRTIEYIDNDIGHLYQGEIVCNDRRTKSRPFYKTLEGDAFCAVIADTVLKNKDKFLVRNEKNHCKYKVGQHEKALSALRDQLTGAEKIEEYIFRPHQNKSVRQEERMIHCLCLQKNLGKFTAEDYQVPTRDGGHDKIDLILSDESGHKYITEVKKFSSAESLLRCVLEIQTYYNNLTETFLTNNKWQLNQIRKAVMFDKDSFAYEQLSEEWAKQLLKVFDITVFILSKNKTTFNIEVK